MKGNLYNFRLLGQIREAKITQEKLAETLDVTIVTLSRIENGHGGSYELILRICELLDIDSSKIFYSTRQLAINN